MEIDIFEGYREINPFEGLDRNAFQSEEAFVEAAVERQIRLSDPVYQKARQRVLTLRRQQLEKEAAEREAAEFAAAVKACVLPRQVQAKIKTDAAAKAAAEVNSGRIGAGEMQARMQRYINEATAQAKREFVSNARANAKIRAQLGANR